MLCLFGAVTPGCLTTAVVNGQKLDAKRTLWDGDEQTEYIGSGWAKCGPEGRCTAEIGLFHDVGLGGSKGFRLHVENGFWAGAGWFWSGFPGPMHGAKL
jgi:hypothetical protein